MWYKNKKTGNTWDITDKNILKRISKDSNYEPYEPEEELPFVADDIEEPEDIEEEAEEIEVKEVSKKAGVSRGTKSATTKAKK